MFSVLFLPDPSDLSLVSTVAKWRTGVRSAFNEDRICLQGVTKYLSMSAISSALCHTEESLSAITIDAMANYSEVIS